MGQKSSLEGQQLLINEDEDYNPQYETFIKPHTSPLFNVPEEILLRILYILDLSDLQAFLRVSKSAWHYNLHPRIWENLSYNMYNITLKTERTSKITEDVGKEAKELFHRIHEEKMDHLYPERVKIRNNKARIKVLKKTRIFVDILYYCLQHPFWEIVFFFSLFCFFFLIPFYIEKFIVGLTSTLFAIPLIIPLSQWTLTFLVSLIFMISRYIITFKDIDRSIISHMIPSGILFLPAVPLLLLSNDSPWDKRDFFFWILYLKLIFTGVTFFSLVVAKILGVVISWWIILLPCWLWFFSVGGFLSFILIKEHSRILDKIYWVTGYIGLVMFLIILGFKLDNIITWRWFFVLLPGMVPSAIWILYPLNSFFFACVNNDYTYLELEHVMSTDSCGAAFLVFVLWSMGIPSSVFISFLILYFDYGYPLFTSWFIIYSPVLVWLMAMLVAWVLFFYFVIRESYKDREKKLQDIDEEIKGKLPYNLM